MFVIFFAWNCFSSWRYSHMGIALNCVIWFVLFIFSFFFLISYFMNLDEYYVVHSIPSTLPSAIKREKIVPFMAKPPNFTNVYATWDFSLCKSFGLFVTMREWNVYSPYMVLYVASVWCCYHAVAYILGDCNVITRMLQKGKEK